ncbi:MAG: TfoX/Sxy family protein [Candidatus Izemoplasmatales bacterium]|nr:TfoX/Sxy family protein [Candidatus Izemoplasmatales bacterium]
MMASSPEFVNYIVDQLQGSGQIRQIKMMGEHCIYCDDVVVGLVICDVFFLKKTSSNHELLSDCELVEPYPGAKPAYLIKDVDDRELMKRIVRNACDDLVKNKKKKRTPSK